MKTRRTCHFIVRVAFCVDTSQTHEPQTQQKLNNSEIHRLSETLLLYKELTKPASVRNIEFKLFPEHQNTAKHFNHNLTMGRVFKSLVSDFEIWTVFLYRFGNIQLINLISQVKNFNLFKMIKNSTQN